MRALQTIFNTMKAGEKLKAEIEVFPILVACLRCLKMIGELYYDNAAVGRLTTYKILCNECYDKLIIAEDKIKKSF